MGRIDRIIEEYGLILESDQHLPSIAGTIIGEKIHRSWWSHPKNRSVFNTLNTLTSRPDILLTKLLSGKTTFIQKQLWPPFLTVANSHEPWQLDNLSRDGKLLLEAVEKKSELFTNKFSKTSGIRTSILGDAARELESRLLIHGIGFHTSSGAHAKHLKTWQRWAADAKYDWKTNRGKEDIKIQESKLIFGKIADRLNGRFGTRPRLSWETSTRSKGKIPVDERP